jgi:GMP synthase-like glutamine amidotransferase
MLAYALGGHAEKSEKGWGLGLKSFAITATKPWMEGSDSNCSLYFVHQDQVTALPPEAELLGGSDFCPNALYTIDDRVLAMQGHPEFSAELMEAILDAPEKRANPQTRQAALDSLHSGAPDNRRMATWVANFLLS